MAASASRTGTGAVMGSKNLKAIAVHGSGSVPVAKPEELADYAITINQEIRNHPAGKELGNYGVVRFISHDVFSQFFPGWGAFEEVHWEEIIDDYGGPAFVEQFQIKNVGCFNCPVRCKNFLSVPGLGQGLCHLRPLEQLYRRNLEPGYECLLGGLYIGQKAGA